MSQSLPNQVNDFNLVVDVELAIPRQCRNPFQTRSTTSMPLKKAELNPEKEDVAIPSKPGQRLQ